MAWNFPILLAAVVSAQPEAGLTHRVKRSFATCEIAKASCTDQDSYPNIAEAFRGYDIILGNLVVGEQDEGYKGAIFDEAYERSGGVRFNNIAGHNLATCSRNFNSKYISTVDNYMKSTISTDKQSKSFQLGSEVKITGTIGEEGAGSVSAERTIPPLYQSLSSNSKSMQEIATNMESNTISITRTWTMCEAYTFQFQPYSPPSFHSGFNTGLAALNQCWNRPGHDLCAIRFIKRFGTHFVKEATFGAKIITTSMLDRAKAQSADMSKIEKCASKKSDKSFLGIVSRGSSSQTCLRDLAASSHLLGSGVQTESTYTVGKALDGWNKPGTYSPAMIRKTLAPLSDLFTAEYMRGQSIDFTNIKPWLEDKILSYCELFKSDHSCNHVIRRPFCPPSRCHIPCQAGLYTGSIDRDFLPHGRGTLTYSWHQAQGVARPQAQRIVTTGDWTHGCPGEVVMQRRGQFGNSADYFAKTFTEYKAGFGQNGEVWLGLGELHRITTQETKRLRVELLDWDENTYHAVYDSFKVGAGPNYAVEVSGFRPDLSTLGDSLTPAGHYNINGQSFSTKDRDRDSHSAHCSRDARGGAGWWWNRCGWANPNGQNAASQQDGGQYIMWYWGGGTRPDGTRSWAGSEMTLSPTI